MGEPARLHPQRPQPRCSQRRPHTGSWLLTQALEQDWPLLRAAALEAKGSRRFIPHLLTWRKEGHQMPSTSFLPRTGLSPGCLSMSHREKDSRLIAARSDTDCLFSFARFPPLCLALPQTEQASLICALPYLEVQNSWPASLQPPPQLWPFISSWFLPLPSSPLQVFLSLLGLASFGDLG